MAHWAPDGNRIVIQVNSSIIQSRYTLILAQRPDQHFSPGPNNSRIPQLGVCSLLEPLATKQLSTTFPSWTRRRSSSPFRLPSIRRRRQDRRKPLMVSHSDARAKGSE